MTGHRLLVTGAANGIGAATVRAARAQGWDVAGLDRSFPGETPHLTAALTADLGTDASTVAAFTELDQVWPEGPTAVVHCAGVYRVEPTSDLTAEAWDQVFGINARGSFLVARESARRMRAGGSLVLMSSLGAERGDAHEPSAAYSASKGAIVSLTRQLSAEWGPLGIRVNAVSPGVIDTAMTSLTDDPDAAAEFFAARVPLRRIGTADEVAQVCLFLASAAAGYVSGAIVPVDGGAAIS
ncbi:SDR family NAD(P)-dependent oxidoreductase [Kineosporia succinea]|uniref:NAD(P)-dependent dehydrogenase (Short-subunit alcohol dehydrogenase family) n=1 Tax=Kineosporia succinea TaxID=84632 RepID=A0ABT9PC03_9ACTN|nr:SDR family oxidoreductase [Kineosporia succinea]MDP9830233.1 NAD(P)-dependent dehydrogenase (short-subunit alcohol dehydrogenase family) [Kineosporia succinea]